MRLLCSASGRRGLRLAGSISWEPTLALDGNSARCRRLHTYSVARIGRRQHRQKIAHGEHDAARRRCEIRPRHMQENRAARPRADRARPDHEELEGTRRISDGEGEVLIRCHPLRHLTI
jgi:hypothetical protein